jgi:hypothetical protein
MAKTIDDCLDRVRVVLAGIDGLRSTPTGVPDATGGIFPFAVAWIGGPGEAYRENASGVRSLDTIAIEIHFQRSNLYHAEAQAAPYLRTIRLALLKDPTLAGTCDTFDRVTNSTFGPLSWGEPAIQTVGWRLEITGIKTREANAAT